MARNPLANYGSNVGDWQPSGGEHDAWGPPSADDVPIEEGEEAAKGDRRFGPFLAISREATSRAGAHLLSDHQLAMARLGLAASS